MRDSPVPGGANHRVSIGSVLAVRGTIRVAPVNERFQVALSDHRSRADLGPTQLPLCQPGVNCPRADAAKKHRRAFHRIQLFFVHTVPPRSK
jgi:hypothetical protein